MKFTVSIRLSNTEGALERVLGRLRQRAFEISSMSADRTQDRAFIDARFTIEGSRDVEPVIKQLAKLYEVQSLKFQYTEGGAHNGQWQNHAEREVCLPV
jgi:acetolactate synthase regulatory subunit